MTQPNKPERFNLSKWALDHGALTRYLMLVLMVLGLAAYFQLGQDEDPPFTFRIMVVRAMWPGATAQQMAEQVTDKIERTLQEVPYADKIRSYSKPGETTILFQLKDSTKASEVANLWYLVRKKVGDMRQTLPAGVQGPFFNDEFGDVYGVIYALEADGFSLAESKAFADDKTRRRAPAPCRRRWMCCRCGWRGSSPRWTSWPPCLSGAARATRCVWVTLPRFGATMWTRPASRCATKAAR